MVATDGLRVQERDHDAAILARASPMHSNGCRLRSFDDDMPEEENRRLTDAVSDLLYVSDPAGMVNLAKEGVPEHRIAMVGNVMIDTLLSARAQVLRSPVLAELGLGGNYGVVTLHRPSNVDHPVAFAELLQILDCLACELPLVFPIHPRTLSRLQSAGHVLDASRWRVVEPLGYFAFIHLLSAAKVVFTDSGGVQEETTVLGVPCLTLPQTILRFSSPCNNGIDLLSSRDLRPRLRGKGAFHNQARLVYSAERVSPAVQQGEGPIYHQFLRQREVSGLRCLSGRSGLQTLLDQYGSLYQAAVPR